MQFFSRTLPLISFVASAVPFVTSAFFSAQFIEARAENLTVEAGGQKFEFSVETPKSASEKGLAILVHGFGRSAKQMQPQAKKMQSLGYVTLTPSVKLNQEIHSDSGTIFAKAFSQLAQHPTFARLNSMPKIIMGHSAGAIWATRFAAERVNMGDTIQGIVLVDPVVRADQEAGFVEALMPLKKLALFAPPSQCNSKNGAKKDVLKMPESFLGLHLKQGSHCDIEGSATDFLCQTFCGKSQPQVVTRVSDIVADWSNALFDNLSESAFLPGGEQFEALISTGEATIVGK